MDIEIVMRKLYESEINCAISSFWDSGWDVKLGEEMNGYVAESDFHTLDEAAEFLDEETRRHFPTSLYTLGPIEFANRKLAR
jgi:hypothetical protein